MVDSDSEHEVDVPVSRETASTTVIEHILTPHNNQKHHRQPRDALTPSVDESGDERMPAEQSSDAEQDEVDDHRMGSASPEPQVLSTSPNLRAPSLAVTPATSNTPAIPEARKRPAAASTEGGPRKRRKDSSKNVPRPNKRRDRPRAPRSKVKIARKPRDVDCNELPGWFPAAGFSSRCWLTSSHHWYRSQRPPRVVPLPSFSPPSSIRLEDPRRLRSQLVQIGQQACR